MTVSNEIKSELNQLAPRLSNVPKQMPYTLPEGYFERLPVILLSFTQAAAAVNVPPGILKVLLP